MIELSDYDKLEDLLGCVLENHVHGGESDEIRAELEAAVRKAGLLPEYKPLPELHVMRDICICIGNRPALNELLADNGPIAAYRITMPSEEVLVTMRDGHTTGTNGDHIIQADDARWYVCAARYYNELKRQNKIRFV